MVHLSRLVAGAAIATQTLCMATAALRRDDLKSVPSFKTTGSGRITEADKVGTALTDPDTERRKRTSIQERGPNIGKKKSESNTESKQDGKQEEDPSDIFDFIYEKPENEEKKEDDKDTEKEQDEIKDKKKQSERPLDTSDPLGFFKGTTHPVMNLEEGSSWKDPDQSSKPDRSNPVMQFLAGKSEHPDRALDLMRAALRLRFDYYEDIEPIPGRIQPGYPWLPMTPNFGNEKVSVTWKGSFWTQEEAWPYADEWSAFFSSDVKKRAEIDESSQAEDSNKAALSSPKPPQIGTSDGDSPNLAEPETKSEEKKESQLDTDEQQGDEKEGRNEATPPSDGINKNHKIDSSDYGVGSSRPDGSANSPVLIQPPPPPKPVSPKPPRPYNYSQPPTHPPGSFKEQEDAVRLRLFQTPLNRTEYEARNWCWLRCDNRSPNGPYVPLTIEAGGLWASEGGWFRSRLIKRMNEWKCLFMATDFADGGIQVEYWNGLDWGDMTITLWMQTAVPSTVRMTKGCSFNDNVLKAAKDVMWERFNKGTERRILYVHGCGGPHGKDWATHENVYQYPEETVYLDPPAKDLVRFEGIEKLPVGLSPPMGAPGGERVGYPPL